MTPQPDLFTQAKPKRAKTVTDEAKQRSASRHEYQIAALAHVARDILERAGRAGATAANLRIAALTKGLITGEEKGRELSYLHAVWKRAGARPTALFRRSYIARSHRIPHRVYVLPEYWDDALHGDRLQEVG